MFGKGGTLPPRTLLNRSSPRTPFRPPHHGTKLFCHIETRIWPTVSLAVIHAVPFLLDRAQLLAHLRITNGVGGAPSPYWDDLNVLVDEAQAIAKPKAVYRVAFVEDRGGAAVVIDGVRLTSRVLRVNLESVHCVFPYVATCGAELDTWAQALDDMLQQYWADVIKEMAMREAVKSLFEHVKERHGLEKTATMSPGSLADWPLTEQGPLFTILGNVEASVGVKLTDSLVMIPNKTVSGLLFPSTDGFASCQLCPREDCPGRLAPYDETLYDRRYCQG